MNAAAGMPARGGIEMGEISRDSDVVELDGPPAYDYGAKVRSRRTIRNDGTYPERTSVKSW